MRAVLLRQTLRCAVLWVGGLLCAFAQTQPQPTATPAPEAKTPSTPGSGHVVELPRDVPNRIAPPQKQTHPSTVSPTGGGLEILSDTGGVDFGPYMRRLHASVQEHWKPLIPEVALPPTMKSGIVTLEFAILKDGGIKAMKLAESSGDVALDRAAWGAIIASNPLPPLPAEFSREFLLLRCRFLYNLSEEEKAVALKQRPTLPRSC